MYYNFIAHNSNDLISQLKTRAGWVVVSETPLIMAIPDGGYIRLSVDGQVIEFSASTELDVGWLDLDVMPKVTVIDEPFDVWLVVNDRRIAGVVGIQGLYQPFYIGLFRPFTHTGNYPHPLFVGGSNAEYWDDVSSCGFFFHDTEEGVAGNSVMLPNGEWAEVAHYSSSVVLHPFDTWYINEIGRTVSGDHALHPAMLMSDEDAEHQAVYGYLDGFFSVSPGVPEEVYDSHILFPDPFFPDYFYALEMS